MLSRSALVVSATASRAFAAEAQQFDRVTFTLNGKKVKVPKHTSLLKAARQNGLYIPTLCNHPRAPNAPATCRLCLVEVDGRLKPSCAVEATEGMKVETDTPRVEESVRGNLALLSADHDFHCQTCDANGKCELQDLTARYRPDTLKLPKLREFTHEWDDDSSDAIARNMDLCVRCGRCVQACNSIQDMNILSFTKRGIDSLPRVQNDLGLDKSKCIECGQCAVYCPVGAITEKSEVNEVLKELESKRKVTIVQTAPAIRVALGEEMNLAPGQVNLGQVVSALRSIGFDHVFDTTFGADVTIMEEGTELLHRINNNGVFPMFTSCCPAWVTMVEKQYPQFIPNLSTARSPHQMQGSLIKTYFAKKLGLKPSDISVVSIMPCTAKKHEAKRPEFAQEGSPDVDHVLTTRELGKILRLKKVPLGSLTPQKYDAPMGIASGAGDLFGATGGVMEAAVRTAYELSMGKRLEKLEFQDLRGLKGIKEMKLTLKKADGQPIDLKIAVCNGVANARHLLERMIKKEVDFHFVEVMACPGGCIGGGGQPKSQDPDILEKRMKAVYTLDERNTIRRSHDNPQVQAIYKEFLGEPCSEKSHHLLHTFYTDRSMKSEVEASPSHGKGSASEETAKEHSQKHH